MTQWLQVSSSDPALRALADRHYSRQTPGAVGFSQNCRRVAFMVPGGRLEWVATIRKGELVKAEQVLVAQAGWVTSWADYGLKTVKYDAWTNTFFRNESPMLASDLIREAIIATREVWEIAPDGIITYIDPVKVKHDRRGVGRTYRLAGFEQIDTRPDGKVVFQMNAERIAQLA